MPTSVEPVRPAVVLRLGWLVGATFWLGHFGAAKAQVIPMLPIEPAAAQTSSGPALGSTVLRAKELRSRPDLDTVAEGDVELRRDGTVIRADRLSYEAPDDLATARGRVQFSRAGNLFSGPELQLRVQRFEGYFLKPTYYFGRAAAGGTAERFDFLDEQRAVATRANYSSCPSDGSGDPAWLLSTDEVRLDFEANEGVARNAVLRFYGVPILAAPVLSFPLTEARKSGWLPPGFNLDSKGGLQVAMPYYWNIAPNRDATIATVVSAKRGLAFDSEFRYLEPRYSGSARLNLLPNDQLTGSSRYALNVVHDSALPSDTSLAVRLMRVSDDDYWKDFPRSLPGLIPRLLASEVSLGRPRGDWFSYARVHSWQVLQGDGQTSRIEAPYQRLPQIGTRYAHRFERGYDVNLETEFNRFQSPNNGLSESRASGLRVHVLGSVAWPLATAGWTLTPKLLINAAGYDVEPTPTGARRSASRVIPTFSLDSAWTLERQTAWLGRSVRQTLEPRLQYVNTPYRAQNGLPNFDSAPKDFNFESIFSENAYSGVDRVSDSHQLTAGVTTRVLDPGSGAETMRLGLVQLYLFRDQRITLTADGLAGPPLTNRLSDLLLLGSTTLIPRWTLDASVQYNADTQRSVRSIVAARYSPGPYRTIGATYRYARDLTEQLELGWQWPLYGPTPDPLERAGGAARAAVSNGTGSCRGSWYAVGRVNYGLRDSRIADSLFGVEYDAGCWIGRMVAERLSTGSSEATTRVMLQLELVGLSRLGSNPLQVLKDNIPGYRLLREDRAVSASSDGSYD